VARAIKPKLFALWHRFRPGPWVVRATFESLDAAETEGRNGTARGEWRWGRAGERPKPDAKPMLVVAKPKPAPEPTAGGTPEPAHTSQP
jgi:hypothetical protein